MSLTCFEVADYFIWLANNEFSDISEFSPMKLQKLTFIAQGWYLGLYGQPLFLEDFQAWKYGPVNPSLYYKYQNSDNQKIRCNFSRPNIPDHITFFIKKIAFNFSYINATVLSGMTHKEGSPWKITRKGLSSKDNSDRIISKELMKTYYESLINDAKQGYYQDPDLLKFLDFLIVDTEANFHKMIPYTEDMLENTKYLLKGVIDW